jgi:dsDNA-specific endonuclease/ATPase MutS2
VGPTEPNFRYHCPVIFDFLLKRLRRAREYNEASNQVSDDSGSSGNPFPEPVVIEFRDVLDLHSIPPRQVRVVVEDYLEEARSRRVRWVRIIHGKGIGVQREIVRSILSRNSFVIDFHDAPPGPGGWGATLATLRVDSSEGE